MQSLARHRDGFSFPRWLNGEAVSNEGGAVELLKDRAADKTLIFTPARWHRRKLKTTEARPAFRARHPARPHRPPAINHHNLILSTSWGRNGTLEASKRKASTVETMPTDLIGRAFLAQGLPPLPLLPLARAPQIKRRSHLLSR